MSLPEPEEDEHRFQDVEISEKSENDEVGQPISFKKEFMEKVTVGRIMSGVNIIGRNEARLMICQYRSVNIESVSFNDPGVLMLDGLSINELQNFLETASESVVDSIKGPKQQIIHTKSPSTMRSPTDNNNNNNNNNNEKFQLYNGDDNNNNNISEEPKTTLPQLNAILINFKNAQDSKQRAQYRIEFFKCYSNMDVIHRLQIPTDMRSIIESAFPLAPSNQDTLLAEVKLPQNIESKISNGDEGEAYITPQMNTNANTALYGEIGAGGIYAPAVVQQVAKIERKNLSEWIKNNYKSQHVWFFFMGIAMAIAFFLQIWIDYAVGQIWRALLMELLCVVSILISLIEADTQFIRVNVQTKIFSYYQFLSIVKGRSIFYLFICFLAFGRLSRYDLLAIFAGLILLILTTIRLFLYKISNDKLDKMLEIIGDSSLARDKFETYDSDNDGYIKISDVERMVGNIPLFSKWLHEIVFWRMDSITNDGVVDVHEFVQFCITFKKNKLIEKRNNEKSDY